MQGYCPAFDIFIASTSAFHQRAVPSYSSSSTQKWRTFFFSKATFLNWLFGEVSLSLSFIYWINTFLIFIFFFNYKIRLISSMAIIYRNFKKLLEPPKKFQKASSLISHVSSHRVSPYFCSLEIVTFEVWGHKIVAVETQVKIHFQSLQLAGRAYKLWLHSSGNVIILLP